MTSILGTLPVQWAVDNLTLGAVDAAGCWWIVRTSEGWHGRPKPKTQRQAKSNSRGSFRAASYGDERIVALTGSTKCPTVAARLDALDRLAAVASDPALVYDLTVTDQAGTRTTRVELDDKPEPRLVGPTWFDWQVVFACPDPLKYDVVWQQPVSGMISASEGGLDFTTSSGLDFTTSFGLDFGTAGAARSAQVANFGTARTSPLFSITGPATRPTVTDVETGEVVAYAGTLGVGDVLTINCAEFPARGFPAHSCFLNTSTNRRLLLTVPAEWPSLGGGEVHNFQLSATTATTAELTVFLRSAWF